MGFSISWIAIEGLTKAEALARAGLTDTARPTQPTDAALACAELPTGWTVLFSNDFDFASERRLKALSAGLHLLAGQVEEHVMYAAASAWRDGRASWRIVHDSSLGLGHLDAEGDLPDGFADAKAAALAQLVADGGEASEVDHLFDVPLEVAADLCGWRHDLMDYDWGEPAFTAVREPARSGALLDRFFRR